MKNKVKRSRKKPIIAYAVIYKYRYDASSENGETEIRELLGLYYSRDVAVQDLIAMLNREYGAGIDETEDNLNAWMNRFRQKGMEMYGIQCEWTIEEVNVDDTQKLFLQKGA